MSERYYSGTTVTDILQQEIVIVNLLSRILLRLAQVQPEQNDNAEFWRSRAEFYYKTCFDLIADMSKGAKIDSVRIDESGIVLAKEQPDLPTTCPLLAHQLVKDILNDSCANTQDERDVLAVIQQIKRLSTAIQSIERGVCDMPGSRKEVQGC